MTRPTRTIRSAWMPWRWVRVLGAAWLVLGLASSCARSPLRPDDDRTPFDRYHRARNTQPEPFIEDEFGRRRPNLRERLLRDEG